MQTNCHLSVLVHEQAKKYGEREALIYQDFGTTEWKSMSWNVFSEKVKTVSNALLNLGVKPQENIAVFSQNSAQYLFCEFGAWGVRAVPIPFYATSSEQQIQFMVNDAKVRIVFVGEQEQYDKACRVLALCPTLEKVIVFDRHVHIADGNGSAMYFEDFLKFGAGYPRQCEVDSLSNDIKEDDLANILYTSGTTGDSKGVMLRHTQYEAALAANHRGIKCMSDRDRVLNFLPYAHIFEKGWTMLSISEGCTLIINTDPRRVQQSMRETHPTCMCSVPRFWEKVYIAVQEKMEKANPLTRRLFKRAEAVGRKHNVEYVLRGKRPPLALHLEYEFMNKMVFSLIRKEMGLEKPNFFPTAGATVSPHVEEFVHTIGLNMMVGYGLTESLATVSNDHIYAPVTIGSVGRPLDNVEVRISDEGEVLLRGATITPGYYNRPDLNEQAFTGDGFFRTGDCGYMKDGELFLKERIKDLFKTSNGKYIAPQMIESKLLVDKYIDQVCLVADERKFVSALIVPTYSLLEEYAREHNIEYSCREDLCANKKINKMLMARIETLQQQLAHYEQIKRFTIMPNPFTMESGELTNTLKLRRRVVNERYKAIIDKMYEE